MVRGTLPPLRGIELESMTIIREEKPENCKNITTYINMYVCVYTYIHTHTHIYTCIHIHTHIHIHVHTYIHTHTYIYMKHIAGEL